MRSELLLCGSWWGSCLPTGEAQHVDGQAQLDQADMSCARTCLLLRAQLATHIEAEQLYMLQEGSTASATLCISALWSPHDAPEAVQRLPCLQHQAIVPSGQSSVLAHMLLMPGPATVRTGHIAAMLSRQNTSDAAATQEAVSCKQDPMAVTKQLQKASTRFLSPAGPDQRLATGAAPYLTAKCSLPAAGSTSWHANETMWWSGSSASSCSSRSCGYRSTSSHMRTFPSCG